MPELHTHKLAQARLQIVGRQPCVRSASERAKGVGGRLESAHAVGCGLPPQRLEVAADLRRKHDVPACGADLRRVPKHVPRLGPRAVHEHKQRPFP